MESLNRAYEVLFIGALLILGVAMIFALFRTIRGPRTADRIMGVNIIGTLTILAISILARCLDQDYLFDIVLIYCMMSFLAVVILSKIYITVHIKKRKKQKEEAQDDSRMD